MTDITIPRGIYHFGKIPGQSPAYGLMGQIMASMRFDSLKNQSDSLACALGWVAVLKLLNNREIEGYREYTDLLKRECWEAAESAGLPEEIVKMVWLADKTNSFNSWMRVELIGLLADFAEQFDPAQQEFADAVAELGEHKARGFDNGLCDAIINLLKAPAGSTVWIPFDMTGQLSLRALRWGLSVVLDGPMPNSRSALIVKLLALIAGKANNLSMIAEIKSVEIDKAPRLYDYLIACPPIGMRIQPGTGWHQWDGFELGLPGSDSIYKKLAGRITVQLDRAESWAMAAMWPRIRYRAVFMTGLNLLFAKGQEQRLREFLVIGQQQPMAVATLPPKLLQFSGIPVALTILDRTNTNGATRFVDSSSMTIESKSTMRFSRQLDSAKLVQAIESEEDVDDVAKSVTLEEIAAQECNLMPARYLKALADDDIDRVPLGELVYEVIRAPVVSKDATAAEVQEVNIPDLGRWGALEGPFVKRTTVQERKLTQCSLEPEDIIISIKGTIGKVGLIGTSINVNGPLVCGQNVIAIRLNRNIVRPISLYLYLRSDDFMSQLEAFRVGAAVAHVTPSTLLQEVRVPIKELREQERDKELFDELCRLECEAEAAYKRIDEIRLTL